MSETYGELYDAMLNEILDCGNLTPSILVAKGDPIAYGQGFEVFVDDGTKFICGCGKQLGAEDAWGADEGDYPTCAECKAKEEVDGDGDTVDRRYGHLGIAEAPAAYRLREIRSADELGEDHRMWRKPRTYPD